MKLSSRLDALWFSFIVFLLSSLLLYLPTFSSVWLMDDYPVIVNNIDIRSFENFMANFFPGRPLRELTYLLDYSLFGLDPWGYNFQNIFWHALNCLLVYMLALRINLAKPIAWLSSLLFLVHPIHVEVVANSSHRKDSLALAFMLMALLAYMKIYDQQTVLRRLLYLAAVFVFWITAFFAKGNALIFPAFIVIYEYALLPVDRRIFLRWRPLFPVLCVSAFIGLIGWYFYISTLPSFKLLIMGAFIKTDNLATFSVYAYILMVLKSFAFISSKLFLPLNLSMEYIYSVPKSLFDPWVISALIMIPLLFLLGYRYKKTNPQLFFLLMLTAVLWFPTANVVWYFSYFAADRYMYAPSAPFCILAVAASAELFKSGGRYFNLVWLSLLSVFAFLAWEQTFVWRNEMSLYSQMLKVSPRSLEAMLGLSNAYYTLKEYDKADFHARQALERDATDYRSFMILAKIKYDQNRADEALKLLLESQKRNPQAPEMLNTLGSVYDRLGNTDQAVVAFKSALKFRPDYIEAYSNLGATFERAKNYTEAEAVLLKALDANNDYFPAWFNLGVVRYRKNDLTGSRLAFYEAVKRNGTDLDALNNLAEVCKELADDSCYQDARRRIDLISPSGQTSQ